VRTGPRGRIYLDVGWHECPLVVEVDGAQHRQGLAVSADNLRRNALTIGGDLVLTIDLVGLRVMTDEFMDQVVAAYHSLTRFGVKR
jgi:very-short-patch-repair endonuclease